MYPLFDTVQWNSKRKDHHWTFSRGSGFATRESSRSSITVSKSKASSINIIGIEYEATNGK